MQGWGVFVLKEKLKWLKRELKKWNKEHFGNLESRFEEGQKEINEIELKGEITSLSDLKIIRKKELQKF